MKVAPLSGLSGLSGGGGLGLWLSAAYVFGGLDDPAADEIMRPLQQAVDDVRRFPSQCDQQAEALGWTGRDLFGLPRCRPSTPRTTGDWVGTIQRA
jgi:hypothetical protein